MGEPEKKKNNKKRSPIRRVSSTLPSASSWGRTIRETSAKFSNAFAGRHRSERPPVMKQYTNIITTITIIMTITSRYSIWVNGSRTIVAVNHCPGIRRRRRRIVKFVFTVRMPDWRRAAVAFPSSDPSVGRTAGSSVQCGLIHTHDTFSPSDRRARVWVRRAYMYKPFTRRTLPLWPAGRSARGLVFRRKKNNVQDGPKFDTSPVRQRAAGERACVFFKTISMKIGHDYVEAVSGRRCDRRVWRANRFSARGRLKVFLSVKGNGTG